MVLFSAVTLAGSPSPRVSNPVAWQAALDRAGFSPGIIDGTIGRRTTTALAAFQRSRGLTVTAVPDAESRRALAIDSTPALSKYTITRWDAASVGPVPDNWVAKAALVRLGYESLAALVAERGHCTLALLARLNPHVNLRRLSAGDTLWIPNVSGGEAPRAASLRIDFDAKTITALDKRGHVVGLFHCSIAREKPMRPSGSCRIVCVKQNPHYWFDPKMWPEVRGIRRKLLIRPGPRNPVGLCWIGLSLDGYGIHGTPAPELIGKTGSHGCFRLTNWDALRLGRMVRVGTPVRFTDGEARVAMER